MRMKPAGWIAGGSGAGVLLGLFWIGGAGASPWSGGSDTPADDAAVRIESEARARDLGGARDSLDFAYFRENVEPILLRDRGGFGPSVSACVTCHVHSATPMPLEEVQVRADGTPYWTEEQSRRNYAAVARLIVPGSPERSRFLRQPLDADAGGSGFHVGGKMWRSTEDPEWQTIAAWIRAADPVPAVEPPPPPDFEFFRTCVQKIFLDKRPGRVECVNCHGGGARGFAQTLPEGRAFWNEEESRENYGILMRYVEPGRPDLSRFLHHPLSPEAGGDPFHGGGRRWESKDDPEWRMLEAWVRGDPTPCVL